MGWRDLFVDTLRTLWGHKLRTGLTMFGIAWGVVSITLMLAAGEGLRVGQQKQQENFGKNIMIVFSGRTSLQAGGARAGRIIRWRATDHLAVAPQAPACRYVLPELGRGGTPVRSSYNSASLRVTGSLPAFAEVRSIPVGAGRFYNQEDSAQARRLAFLGSDVAKQLFGSRNPLGETIQIGAFPYTIIGVMAHKEQDSSYDGRDIGKIFIPFGTMIRDFPDKPPLPADRIDRLLVSARSEAEHDECKAQLRRALGRLHGFDPADTEAAFIWDTVQNARAFLLMMSGMKYFLGAVGVVTILLGGIGVMNVMLVAVRERTREIGVRKAVGATSRAILGQFFVESMLVALMSGGLGMGFGFGVCALVNRIPMPAYFSGMLPSPEATAASFVMLGLVAVFSAVYPARCAAAVDPIEALRFEAGG